MPQCISILGCGWLGLPLGKFLSAHGCRVKGSTTDPEKIILLWQNGIEPFLLKCQPELEGENQNSFFDAEILVLTLPFRRDLADPVFYKKQIQSVLTKAGNSSVKWVIFTSSTAVYPDSLSLASEDSVFIPDNPRAVILLEVEQLILNQPSLSGTVIRFAGLYGPDRPLGRFLAGKNVERPDGPVNLIHLDDCVSILWEIIRQDVRAEVLNACSDEHPSRREVYTAAARRMNLSVPHFTNFQNTKVVTNTKLKERLNYRFQHPDPKK